MDKVDGPVVNRASLARPLGQNLASDGRSVRSLRLLRDEDRRQLGVEISSGVRKRSAGSTKQRKGDPVPELDSAIRRVDHAGGTAGKTETFGPLGRRELAAMSARPARVWPTACGGSAPPGAKPLLVQRPPASTPSSRRQSVGDRSPRSRTRRCWWRSKPTWRQIPQGLGSASGLSRLRVARNRRMREQCSRPIAAAPWRQSP